HLSEYIPEFRGTNKSAIAVKDALLHQAGFVNLNFHGKVRSEDYSRDSSAVYPIKVADNFYLRRDYYAEVMWPSMLRSPLPTKGRYVYSDISMYVMKEIIERQSGKTLDKYVQEAFYMPLGM